MKKNVTLPSLLWLFSSLLMLICGPLALAQKKTSGPAGTAAAMGPPNTAVPIFISSDAPHELLVGETFNLDIQAYDPDAHETMVLKLEEVHYMPPFGPGYGPDDWGGATFTPGTSVTVTNSDTATIRMAWTPTREYLGEMLFLFSASDPSGNEYWQAIYFLVDLPFALEETQPLTLGAGQHYEQTIRIANDEGWHVLTDLGNTEGVPDWLNIDLITLDGREQPTAIRIWGTPPAGTSGTFRPVIPVRTHYAKWDELRLELHMEECQNTAWYSDADGDGFGSWLAYSNITSCNQPAGYVSNREDCNDQDAATNPAAPEVVDGIDNNCDSRIDEGNEENQAPIVNVMSNDHAAVGEQVNITLKAFDPNKGDLTSLTIDSVYHFSRDMRFELADFSFNPAPHVPATDTANIAISWTAKEEQLGLVTIHYTAKDQHGNTFSDLHYYFVDLPFSINPAPSIVIGTNQHFEMVLGIENDHWNEVTSAQVVDRNPSWLQADYISIDGEYGRANAIKVWGSPPAGSWGTYTPNIAAGVIFYREDTVQLNIRVGNCQNQWWYKDKDGDGFGDPAMKLTACWQPTGYVSNQADCDDTDPAIYAGATELPDGIDNNCNGAVDEEGSCFASQVVSFRQGFRPDGRTIGRERSNPALALGAPQENNRFNFVSLGFGGELVLELGALVYDDGTEAPDLMVVETTWGWSWRHCYDGELAGNPETMVMEVSANGSNWVSVPGSFCRNAKVDLSTVVGEGKLPYVRYVKITDTSNPADFHPSSNGYDVDGIITCPALFDQRQTNSRIAGAYNPNFFNEAPEEEDLQQLSFYPNPVKDQLTIQTGTTEKLEVKVYSLQGSLLYKGQYQPDPASGNLQLDLAELAQGVYLIRLQGDTLQEFIKIMKE